MPSELLQLYMRLPVFALVAGRLAGLVFFQPLLASLAVPHRWRALLVLALSALVTCALPPPTQLPGSIPELILALASEVLLGAAIGLAVALVLVGAQIGGMLVAQESGLNFGQIVDPASGEDLTPLSMFYMQLAILVFLLADGQRALVRGFLNTFATIPLPGDIGRSPAGLDLALDALRVSFELSIQIAAPTLVALTLANLTLGFAARTVPQLNVLSVGFALKTVIGLAVMALALGPASDAITRAMGEVLEMVRQWTE